MTEQEAEVVREEPKTEEVKTATVIGIDQRTQALMAKDNSELIRVIRVMMKGAAFPKSLNTEEKVIAAWQIAASFNLPPAVAIRNIAIIEGSACIWGELPKALAESTGELEEFKLILIDDQQDVISLEKKNLDKPVWGAVVQIKRKGRSMNEYSFTMLDAKKAGLDKKTGTWQTYTKIMLSRRTVGQAIKFEFPDALMGVGIAEYDHGEAPDLRDVTPSKSSNEESESISAKLRATAEEVIQ